MFCFVLFSLGNPAIGILKHKDRCYVFSSKESAYIFAQDPDKFIQLTIEKAKEHAELIHLLELHHHFEYLAPYTQVHIAPSEELSDHWLICPFQNINGTDDAQKYNNLPIGQNV